MIVSHDAFNQTESWQSIIVVPLSNSVTQARRGPTAPSLPRGTAGLLRASVAHCHQVTTLDRSKLTRQIGTLPSGSLEMIQEGLKAAMFLL